LCASVAPASELAEEPEAKTRVATVAATLTAVPAGDVRLSDHHLADADVLDVSPGVDDFADEFVAKWHRKLVCSCRPRVPLVEVQIRAADCGTADADQDLCAAKARHRLLF
jgi:hypothetical protein